MTQGFISIEEIQNVWTEFLTKLDNDVMPKDGPFHREAVFEHCANLKFELLKRTKRNLDELLAKGPMHVKPDPRRPTSQPVTDSRVDFMNNQDRLRAMRMKNGLGS